MLKRLSLLVLIAIISFGFTDPKANLAIEKVKSLFRSTKDISSLSYQFVRTERINGKMVRNLSQVKMQRKPYKVYVKETFPNNGVEVLYPHPDDDSKVLINPNGFPWVNLKLDPLGDLMKRNQHHTVMEGGFDYIVSVMEYIFYKHRSNIAELIEYEGITLVDGRSCDIITLSNPDYKYNNYKVKKGESTSSIATKYRINEFMIVEKNNLGYIRDLNEGEIIKLPSDYSAKMTLYLDRDRQIPLMMKIFDDTGLFEEYEFRNVVINPILKSEEFSDTYASYKFN